MTEYAADDYAAIARRQKELSSPPQAPGRYGIWVDDPRIPGPTWLHVFNSAVWAYTGPNSLNPELSPTLYTTEEEAQTRITMGGEPPPEVKYEVRPYPGEHP